LRDILGLELHGQHNGSWTTATTTTTTTTTNNNNNKKKKDNPCQLDFVMKSLARINAGGLDGSCESPTHWQFHILRQKQQAIPQALVVASAKPRGLA